MVVLKINKIDVGAYGEAYFLTIGNLEEPKKKDVQINISECQAEMLKPLFSNSKKSGKLLENEEWF